MNRDRIERALREPGPRERGYSPEALPATAAELRARVPRRNRLLMSAGAFGGFAAAVAAGAVIAVVLSRGVTPGPGTGGTVSSPTPTSVRTSSPTPAPTPAPTPTSSPAPVAACRAGDFAWSYEPWGGDAGGRGTILTAKHSASAPACDLAGPASVVVLDANGHTLVSGYVRSATAQRVQPGETLHLGINWSNWCGSAPAEPVSVTLTMPDGSTAGPFAPGDTALLPPPCNGASQPSSLSVADFQR